MDDIVIRGMAKWPNVPAVYGWLTLDRRGSWLLKGDRITHPSVTAFIGRNYSHDERGRWFFQNGPQRVYVDLEYTPLVYRVSPAASAGLELEAHNGRRIASAIGAWIDEEGTILLETTLGIGIVHDKDLDVLTAAFVDQAGRAIDEETLEARLDALQRGDDVRLRLAGFGDAVDVCTLKSSEAAKRFAFVAHPRDDDNGMTI